MIMKYDNTNVKYLNLDLLNYFSSCMHNIKDRYTKYD